MAEKLMLSKRVIELLSNNPEQRFTAREIAEWIFDNYTQECMAKLERTSVNDKKALVNRIQGEIGSHRPRIQRRDPRVKATEDRPRKYYWAAESEQAEIDGGESETIGGQTPSVITAGATKELDLYPLLCGYLWSEFQVYPKRIDEKTSSNKRGSKGNLWLHPDLVGMEDLTLDWEKDINDAVKSSGGKRTKLWSFEVKKELTMSSVRPAYFQAVSNSSWANFGYLGAKDIDDDAMKELRMLSSLHGIGLIKIDADNPPESQILIPARERPEVDWNACNLLAKVNKDFLSFVQSVENFHTATKRPIRAEDWDLPEDWDSDD